MGATACAAIAADPELQLVAAVGRSSAGRPVQGLTDQSLTIDGDLEALASAGCQVVVDLSVADAARVTLPWLAAHGIHAVVGTTGLTPADIELCRRQFRTSNCVISANFAISAVLMTRFAELAAPYFDTAEIIELHHEHKVDAPSGTAVATADRMAAASDRWIADPTTNEMLAGARGGHGPAGIRLHSVRMRGMMAHQEVILGTTGQTLTIRQDSYDRSSFMPGVLLAVKRVAEHPGVTLGLDALLGV